MPENSLHEVLRDKEDEIKILITRNEISVNEMNAAIQRAKNTEQLRKRDITVMCLVFVVFVVLAIVTNLCGIVNLNIAPVR
ncbi:MAG: hypothetical protein K0U40_08130 [Betaproteobacteria bacterium]|nr:hypothetical protein [Betaproteobacteria bacterium]